MRSARPLCGGRALPLLSILLLKQAGYTVIIAFVFVESPALCIARVEERVRKGGHHVPEDDVVRRFYRSKRNFWSVYRHRADTWQLYYNVDEGFQGVATGKGDAYTVSNESLFTLFIQDINNEKPDAGS